MMNASTIKKLSYLGSFFTLIVISAGAWVRLTDAGLGCPDWPGCYGILGTPDTAKELYQAKQLYPDAEIDIGKAWREMLHRYLAGMLGLYVFFISFLTWKYVSHVTKIMPTVLVGLIIVQSLMGMLTVTELVKPTIVTTHLVLGMTTACLLLWNGFMIANTKRSTFNGVNYLYVVCTLALLFQIILGRWTSTNYASLACTDFPKCSQEWYPQNMDFSTGFTIVNLPDINYEENQMSYAGKLAVHYSHRLGALVVLFLFLSLFWYLFFVQKSTLHKKIGYVILFFFILQISLGISNVVYSLPLSVAVLHTVNACILMMSMLTLLFYSTYNTR